MDKRARENFERIYILFFLFWTLLLIFSPIIISCIGDDCSNSTSEVVTTRTDAEKVLKAIVRPLNVGMLGEIIVAEEDDMKTIQEYVREHYNIREKDYGLRLNENYCLGLGYNRELLLIYTDSNRIRYETVVEMNIDIPWEEIRNSDYYLKGDDCQWSVKGNEVSKWIFGEKVDSFDIPEGLKVIEDEFGDLWLGQKDENDSVKSLCYFRVEERECVEVSTSLVINWEKCQNSIFYLDVNKNMWHFNLLTGESEIIYEDIEKVSFDFYIIVDDDPETPSSQLIIFGAKFYNEIVIPPYYINYEGEKAKWPEDIDKDDTLFDFSYFQQY